MNSSNNRIIKGLGSSVFYQVVLAVQAIVLVPFFLNAWGPEEYGHWLTLTAFVSYLTLLDLGGQNYIANSLAILFAKKDFEGFSKTLSEGISLFLFIGICGLGIWGVLIWFGMTWSPPGLNRLLFADEAWILVFMGALFLLFSNVGGLYATVYKATGLYARGAMIGNGIKIIGIVLSIILLNFSIEPKDYAAFQFVFGGILCFLVVMDSRRKIKISRELKINLKNAKIGKKHLKGSFYFWVLAFSQAIKQHGSILILASFASPIAVSTYSTHRVLSNCASYIRVLLHGPILPELSFLWGENRVKELHDFILIALKWIVVLTGIVSIFIWFAGAVFYPLWTGEKLEIKPLLFLLLLLQGVLSSGTQTACWGLIATNHHQTLSLWTLASSCLTLTLVFYLVPQHGAEGIVLAEIISEISIGVLIFPILSGKFLKTSPTVIYQTFFKGLLILSPFVGFAYLLDSWLSNFNSILIFLLLCLMAPVLFREKLDLRKLKSFIIK
jgi:O-antigen/teichoic acid export membrane protein